MSLRTRYRRWVLPVWAPGQPRGLRGQLGARTWPGGGLGAQGRRLEGRPAWDLGPGLGATGTAQRPLPGGWRVACAHPAVSGRGTLAQEEAPAAKVRGLPGRARGQLEVGPTWVLGPREVRQGMLWSQGGTGGGSHCVSGLGAPPPQIERHPGTAGHDRGMEWRRRDYHVERPLLNQEQLEELGRWGPAPGARPWRASLQ